MSIQAREGIRAAKALLSLIDDSSAEELEAAEDILGGDKELTNILQLLRKYKGHEVEPLSIEGLRDIVRKEILDLHLSKERMARALISEGMPVFLPPALSTAEKALDRALVALGGRDHPRSREAEILAKLLINAARTAGPEQVANFESLLRGLASRVLIENLVMFPTAHTLAELRTRWASSPLPYESQESRKRLVARLLADAEQLAPDKLREITVDLLREGLRGPADGEIARMRAARPKKAHGAQG